MGGCRGRGDRDEGRVWNTWTAGRQLDSSQRGLKRRINLCNLRQGRVGIDQGCNLSGHVLACNQTVACDCRAIAVLKVFVSDRVGDRNALNSGGNSIANRQHTAKDNVLDLRQRITGLDRVDIDIAIAHAV